MTFKKSKGAVIWLTGYSGAGKSTIANAIETSFQDDEFRFDFLTDEYIGLVVLDGDTLRKGICSDLGFSKEDREKNVLRTAHIANILAKSGLLVCVAFISPYNKDRKRAREICEGSLFLEVFVGCPLDICKTRDPKGLYKRADKGLIKNFTGISDPYEFPVSPDIILDTSSSSVEECVDQVLSKLSQF